ncbi:MAG: DUF84 family protein [Halobacteriaceae archaeon]
MGDHHKHDVAVARRPTVHLVVGSGNPVKRRAVEATLGDRVESVTLATVKSGVPDQPKGHEQTRRGACTRARRALRATEADIGVGLEGGVWEPSFTEELFLIMWGAGTDGERLVTAAGPQFPLPDPLASAIRDGRELGPALDEHLGREGTKYEEGVSGFATGGLTDRATALSQAVAGAVGPLVAPKSRPEGAEGGA